MRRINGSTFRKCRIRLKQRTATPELCICDKILAFWHVNIKNIKQLYIPAPSSRGAKWLRLTGVEHHHPLGFNWHPFEGAGMHIV